MHTMYFIDNIIMGDVTFLEHEFSEGFLIEIAINVIGDISAFCGQEER